MKWKILEVKFVLNINLLMEEIAVTIQETPNVQPQKLTKGDDLNVSGKMVVMSDVKMSQRK